MKTHRILLALALGATLFTGGAALADQESSLKLELRTRKVLLEKLGIDGMRVDVRAADGIVWLSGTVKQRETAELAESVVKSLDGVSRVENEIRLEEYENTKERTTVAANETERELKDAALHSRVRAVLIDRLGRDGFRIGIDTAGTAVSLSFPSGIDSARRKDAIRVVRQMSGVEKVIDLEKK